MASLGVVAGEAEHVDDGAGRHRERAVARSGWELVAAVQWVREKCKCVRLCGTTATTIPVLFLVAAAIVRGKYIVERRSLIDLVLVDSRERSKPITPVPKYLVKSRSAALHAWEGGGTKRTVSWW